MSRAEPHRQWPNRDELVPLLLLFIVSSVYFMTVTGITDGNAGSHYAAVRALSESGHLDIAGYEAYTQLSDYALGYDGALHSDRPPATALLAAATYELGQVLPRPPVQVPSNHDGDNPRVIFGVLAAVLSGAATVGLFYAILRQHYATSATAAGLAALALAFGTQTWKYSTTLYSHAASGLFVLLSVTLALRAARRGSLPPAEGFALGLALGASVLAEYTNVVFVGLTLAYLAFTLGDQFANGLRDPASRPAWLQSIGAAALGSALPVAFFFAYNRALFGGFFQLSAYWVDPAIWGCCDTFGESFSTPLFSGLWGNLFYGNRNQGLFLLTPISLLAFAGWRASARHSWRDFVYLLGTFAVMLALFSKVTTVNPDTDDSRYIVPFLALWYLPLGVWLDRSFFKLENAWARLGASALFYGLLFLSMRNIFVHVAFSWNYDLRLDSLPYDATPPRTVATLLATVFPNADNLPLLWGLEAAGAGLLWGLWRLARALPGRIVRPVAFGGAALALVAATLFAARTLSAPVPPTRMLPLEAAFDTGDGTLHLAGYRVPDWFSETGPGDPLRLRLYWQAEGDVGGDYTVVLWLLDADGVRWGESRTPLGGATWRVRPPDSWRAGEIFQEEITVPLSAPPPDDTATTVWLALESPDGERLPLHKLDLEGEFETQIAEQLEIVTFSGLAQDGSSAVNPNDTLRLLTFCDEQSCRLLVEELATGQLYELRGPFLSWRPFSDLTWVNTDILAFTQWSNPHYGIRYEINFEERSFVSASAMTDEYTIPILTTDLNER